MGISKINEQTLPTSTTPITTTRPTISLNSATPVFGALTVTISNHSDYTNPNYSAVCTLDDGTVTVTDANIDRVLESDESHLAGTLKLIDTNESTEERTITVKAQEFEDSKQSATQTATYVPSTIQNQYLRIRGVNSDGDQVSNRIAIMDVNFYAAAAQSGTVYPTTNLTANGSETGIAVSQGHLFSSLYDAYLACDSSTTTMAWLLGTSAANNYWQIEFETGTYSSAPIIKSIDIKFHAQNDATHFALTGSNNADHSSATVYAIFEITAENTVLNFG